MVSSLIRGDAMEVHTQPRPCSAISEKISLAAVRPVRNYLSNSHNKMTVQSQGVLVELL